MKLIITVFLLFTMTIPLFCQDKGYRIHSEYSYDSRGKAILKTGLLYQMISNKSSSGFIDTLGNVMIPLGKYNSLNPIDEQGMILAKKGRKEGFIDINENILVPFIYEDLGVFSKCVDLAPAVKNKKQGFINRKGETIIPFEYDYISYIRYFYEPGIAVLVKNRKYGVINGENKIIIPFIYNKIDLMRNNDVIIAWKQDKWASFSTTGEQLSDFNNYEIVSKSPLGYLPADSKNLPILVTTNESKGDLYDIKGTIEYRNANEQQRSIMIAQGGVKYAYLDKSQTMVVPFGVYDYADVFGLGRKAIVANKEKYGIINEHGELVLPLEYDFIEQPSKYSNYANIFLSTKQSAVTIFDEELNVIPITGIVSYLAKDGSIYVTNQQNKKGLVSYNGELTTPFLYDTLYQEWPVPRINGYIAKKDGLYGYITSSNKIIQPFKYNDIYALNGNAVYVDQNNKVGIFDDEGKLMIPFEYDAIYDTYYNYEYLEASFPNTNNIYIVEKDGKIGTIDDKNSVVIPVIYDGLSGWVEYGPEDHFVKNNDKYGIISPKGEIIIPIEYDYVGIPRNGIILVRKNGKYGVMSTKNKEILPCIYDKVFIDIPWVDFGDKKPKIVASQQNVWKYFELNGKLLQSNVPSKEINDNYNYINNINWDKLSNEYRDFDLKQKGGLK